MAYFSNKISENPELQADLNSAKPEKKKEAIKQVIAAMTIGKDVSSLFPHVIKSMETANLDLKKLVYLYIINYAKSQPDLAILAVNSFRKDSRNPSNPLIRALAVRTMGCIRVERITEYLCEPLKDALQDEDPYVRKTAAVCVAKLYDIAPEMVEDDNFIEMLETLLADGNSMVVSNAVAALIEISHMRKRPALRLNPNLVNKILTALNECNEWGQIYILDYIVTYTPADIPEAESIIERVLPRLAHNNSAVVLSAAKVVMKYMDFVTSSENIRSICRKLAPSLVSLLSTEAEMQYIALKCISLIAQKRPNILDKEIRVFFCKYNDPIYVKLEKLEVMVKLSDLKNIDQVLHELKEYATEVDIEFVRKSVRTIGRCAIKLEKAADRCISCLLELISLKVNYVVQEAIIVIRDIFRKYPNRYEMIIKELFENLENLDEPEAKASMIWILGEYAERIDDALSQLANFFESFADEPSIVQLSLLTAVVKHFLKKPDETESLVSEVLKVCTEATGNPDIRDRAFLYWRMLSTDPEAAKQIICGEKPNISDETGDIDSVLLDKFIDELGRLSSIYQKPADAINTRKTAVVFEKHAEDDEEVAEFDSSGQKVGNVVKGTGDLLGLQDVASLQAKVPLQVVLNTGTSGVSGNLGLQIEMAFQRESSEIVLEARFTNNSTRVLSDWAMQFNVNPLGLAMSESLILPDLQVSSSKYTKISISSSGTPDSSVPSVPLLIQIAVKCSLDVFYFQCPCMFSVVLVESGRLSKEDFKSVWSSTEGEFSHSIQNINASHKAPDDLQRRLELNNVFFIAGRLNESNENVMYFSSKSCNNVTVLCEIRLGSGSNSCKITCKASSNAFVPLYVQAVNFLLSSNS
jgi:AP-1 complex subunit beta-1